MSWELTQVLVNSQFSIFNSQLEYFVAVVNNLSLIVELLKERTHNAA